MTSVTRSFLLFITIIVQTCTRNADIIQICNNLKCDNASKVSVCGIRDEETIVSFKLFENECALLKHGCSVTDKEVYGLIGMEYCERVISRKRNVDKHVLFKTESIENLLSNNANKVRHKQTHISANVNKQNETDNDKCNDNCDNSIKDQICGIRQDGNGYRVRLFESKCELARYSCVANIEFIRTDMFICKDSLRLKQENTTNINDTNINGTNINDTNINGTNINGTNINDTNINGTNINDTIKTINDSVDKIKTKNIIVVDSSVIGRAYDVNETIDNFFAATHVLDLPITQMDEDELNTRRMRVKNVGPIKVFKPWIIIPKEIKVDRFHTPTLSTCYHKCPTKCPDTYAPVCGVPGIKAREPSIMFQNHCYMDVAQCKMYWENKSETAITSSYIESSFLFCLGDQLNGLYRFLPLIKTLQHMGRLKKKGRFRYKMRNMKFFNNLAIKEPKLMG